MSAPAALERALADVVGPRHVLTDPGLVAAYATDWTGRFTGAAAGVVRPADTEQVATCVRLCADAGVPITAQGGNTGLAGGAVPADGGMVLSLRRLDAVAEVDQAAAELRAQAGAPLAAVQRQARAAGWDFGVDLAARDSATVGGMVATNAGGLRVIRHGPMRAQLLGAEAVLASGAVVRRMEGPAKDSVGYDIAGLLAGSEGTLGILTAVRLRLVPAYAERAVAVVGVDGVPDAIQVLGELRRRTDLLDAAELMFAEGVDLGCGTNKLRPPLDRSYPAYLLVETPGTGGGAEQLASLLADIPQVRDASLAADGAGRARLWRYREAHTEAIATLGTALKLDVAVPVARLPELAAVVDEVTRSVAPGARTHMFGHLGEGNLHINVVDAIQEADALTDALLTEVGRLGGSIAAEHGVGRAKRAWLGLSRSAAEIEAMRAIKAALDPAGVLNPGVLLP